MSKEKNNSILKLHNTLPGFGNGSAEIKKQLLKECSSIKLNNSKQIELYHNCLLFLLGYSENEELFLLAQKEMSRLSEAVKNLPPPKKENLDRSGIAFTEIQGAYSFTLIKWLLKEFPGQISLHSFDDVAIHPREIFKNVLSEMEFELASDEKLNPLKWLEKASGSKKKTEILNWLIHHFEELNASDLIKDQLFESLKLFINIAPKEKEFSKSFGNILQHKNFYHGKGLLKKFDERELIHKKLPAPKKLSLVEKKKIIDASRVALCLLNRETDPITYCNEDGLLFYELEHGLSITLFSMLPERCLPMESYIGFMMFKNGYPMSYGGAWVFGKRSLIGINIFESFRGGESAFVFAQLLRTYKQSCGADYFEVEPYQFGKGNPEGIKSGAFWFYYRFGFRPIDKTLNELSEKESAKIQSDKTYRSSYETLKKFTQSNLAVHFNDKEIRMNPSVISKFISNKIATVYKGDRAAAEKFCLKILRTKLKLDVYKANKQTITGINKLGFFVGFCLDIEKLKASEKTKLKEWVIEKGNSEYKYIELTNKINFKKFLNKELL